MSDQNLVATHDASFLVKQLSYLSKQTCNCLIKFALWYILTTFLHKRSSFALLSVNVFKKIRQKLKSPNAYE